MHHDSERAVAGYLAGDMPRCQRERFESHMLECDDCWDEVRAGRRGRALVESLREVAPQRLRERVRAGVAAAPATRPRRGRPAALFRAVAAAAAVLAGGLVASENPQSPTPVDAAIASYRDGMATWPLAATAQPPADRLGRLTWRSAHRGDVGGIAVVAHTYEDATGRRIVLLRASRWFPPADDAKPDPEAAAPTWIAHVDGMTLFCANHPQPSLLVGAREAEVMAAARQLGLR